MNQLIGPLLALCLLLSGTALYLAWNQGTAATGYVDLARVYEEFQYKKQLEQALYRVDQQAQYLLDSMEIQLNGVAQLVSTNARTDLREEYRVLQRDYALTERELIDQQRATAQEYDEQIWTQLNQYLQDFAQGGQYDYLIGTRGEGTIVGGGAEYDLTDEIIEYVNQRYDGQMD